VEGTALRERSDVSQLGTALSKLGIPWLLTLISQSGLSIEGGPMIWPLLWFAPPFVVLHLAQAAAILDGVERMLLRSAAAVGLLMWLVAVPVSLLGNEEVARTAYWVGVGVGSLLYSAAMFSFTTSMGWAQHRRRWRSTTALLIVIEAGTAAIVIVSILTESVDPTLVANEGWQAVAILAALILTIVGLVKLARIHRATWSALRQAP
jgi:NO-binding membrane sensor protein with MHYT domain